MHLSLGLVLAATVVVSASATEILQFRKLQQCPSSTQLHQTRVSSELQCSMVCSVKANCNTFHIDSATGSCHMGEATTGTCAAFIYSPQESVLPPKGAAAVLHNLEMKLLYRFRKSGLTNEVNPRMYQLTAHGPTVGSEGAEFYGKPKSYLSVDTPGFEQYLDYGKTFSFYYLIRQRMDYDLQFYHIIGSDVPPYYNGHLLAKRLNYMYAYSFWTQGGYGRYLARSGTFIPTTNVPITVSVGCAFNRTVYQHYYFNGSIYERFQVASPFGPGEYTDSIGFQKLWIGYSNSANYSLNGTIYCFGMSSKILGLEDFKLLEEYCSTSD